MAFTLVVVVGPGTRAGQAAWALGGSGHVEGVSLGRGRKARCGGPRDAGWARQKPWSQQTLVSPRLWLKGPPGSQASSRGEAKDSALLSSRDAGLLEPPERPQPNSVRGGCPK